MDEIKILLNDSEIPRQWYNIQADLPTPLRPPLNPATGKPIRPEDLAPIFPMPLIEQEVSTERWIDIPEEVLAKYLLWRPTPLRRARNFEKVLNAPVKIYYKDESVSPAGSHKPNTAVAQAYYNKISGVKRLSTETGAGQWGSALAMACHMFGIECRVFMVKVSFYQKPYRRMMMATWGANCIPSPSETTEAGRRVLAEHPDSPGSLGIAISEAIEDAVRGGAKYSLGSVLNHVLLHQTIIGLEAQKQMAEDRRVPGRGHRLRGRRQQLCRNSAAFCARQDSRQTAPNSRLGTELLPDPDARARSPTTSATWPRRRRCWPCTRWDMILSPRRSTRAACATTAWRPSSATCSRKG